LRLKLKLKEAEEFISGRCHRKAPAAFVKNVAGRLRRSGSWALFCRGAAGGFSVAAELPEARRVSAMGGRWEWALNGPSAHWSRYAPGGTPAMRWKARMKLLVLE
jgi:hypothetical protein